jgi:hypothetical protein
MSYTYSQLSDIIALQYAKKEGGDDNWFLEQTIKLGKGYIQPSNYLKNIGSKIIEDRNNKDNKKKVIDNALYIDI